MYNVHSILTREKWILGREELSVHLLNKIISRFRETQFLLIILASGNPVRIMYKKPYATCSKNLNTTELQCLLWKDILMRKYLDCDYHYIVWSTILKMIYFSNVIPWLLWLLWLGVVNKCRYIHKYIVNYSTEKMVGKNCSVVGCRTNSETHKNLTIFRW